MSNFLRGTLFNSYDKLYAIFLKKDDSKKSIIKIDDKIKDNVKLTETETEIIIDIDIDWVIKLEILQVINRAKTTVINISDRSKIQSLAVYGPEGKTIINGRMLYLTFGMQGDFYDHIIINTPSLPKLYLHQLDLFNLELYNHSENTTIYMYNRAQNFLTNQTITNVIFSNFKNIEPNGEFKILDYQTCKEFNIIDNNTKVRVAYMEYFDFLYKAYKIRLHSDALV